MTTPPLSDAHGLASTPTTRRRASAARALALVSIGAVASLTSAWRGGWPPAGREPAGAGRRLARAELVVLDGDTLLVRGRVTRLLGVDAPERAAPWFDAAQEPWAGSASDLVRRALDRARVITLVPGREAQDQRGRDLAHVVVDGRTLSALLVESGLGVETSSRFGDGGLPDLAAQVRAAAARRGSAPTGFEEPSRWRRRHRLAPVANPDRIEPRR